MIKKRLNTFAGVLLLSVIFTAASFVVTVKGHSAPPQDSRQITVESLVSLLKDASKNYQYLLIDARSAESYLQGHIPGAISIDYQDFDRQISKLPDDKDQLIIYYCDGTS